MSKTKKASKRQLRLSLYNLTLTRCKAKFKPGTVFTAQELATMFYQVCPKRKGSYEQIHAENMRMLRLQQELNSLLRASGMYLRSSNYYKYFTVVDKAATKAQVERMSASIDRLQVHSAELEEGIKSRKWGTFKKQSKDQLGQLVQPITSTRHDKLVGRLSRIK